MINNKPKKKNTVRQSFVFQTINFLAVFSFTHSKNCLFHGASLNQRFNVTSHLEEPEAATRDTKTYQD